MTSQRATPRGLSELGIQPRNAAPWCLRRPADDVVRERAEAAWAEHVAATELPPYCPDGFFASTDNLMSEADGERWATRGAINSGLAVFTYLDALSHGLIERFIPYDHCEDLTQ